MHTIWPVLIVIGAVAVSIGLIWTAAASPKEDNNDG